MPLSTDRDDAPPASVLTFLFTDIEGSTRLLDRLGDGRYAVVLGDHHQILGAAIALHGGEVVSIDGDAFFAVFDEPAPAVAAAIAAQLALQDHRWSDEVTLHVRMGIHTGRALRAGANFVGMSVHQAARVAAAAHGGQVLASSATVDALHPRLADITVRPLGLHRLKDLGAPTALYQLGHRALPDDFPPVRSLEHVLHNIPVQLSSFVGRRQEMVVGANLVAGARLVTITGTGGVGKTRLAYQLAADQVDQFIDGVWAVELANAGSAMSVADAFAKALAVRSEPGRDVEQTVADHLRGRTLLLVVDNCEHVIADVATLVAMLLTAAPGVKVMATSRAALRLPGECVWALDAMALPRIGATVDELSAAEPVRLFCDRAGDVSSRLVVGPEDLAAVAAICSRLDGVPLAIELAAARVRSLSPVEIASRLDSSLELLTKGHRGAPARQASLRATIAWSVDMLDDRQRLLFARLSVFTGGWDLGAAEEVASGGVVVSSLILDLQESLIENSLVLADHTDHLRSRYRMLEAVRAYAAEALEALGGTVEVRDRLAAWALGVVEPRERPWIPEMSDAELSRLDREHANLLEALDHLGRQGRPEEIDLALALGPFWLLRVQWNTAHGRLRSALDRHPEGDAARVRACLLLDHVEGLLGDWRATRDNLDAALEIAVRLGDGPSLCDALHVKGGGLMSRGKYEAAASLLTEAVGRARALGDAARELDSVGLLALIASIVGHHHEARAQAERALALARLRSDPGREHRWLEQLGWIARDLGEPAEAERLFAQAAAVAADSTLGVDPPLDGR